MARVVDRRADHCRQLARRARQWVREGRPHVEADPVEHERLLARFLQATEDGDLASLEATLSEDVVLLTDGGGNAPAALNSIHGPDCVGRFMVGVRRKVEGELSVTPGWANGVPAALLHVDGRLDSVITLDVQDGRITALFIVRNPDKLPRAGMT